MPKTLQSLVIKEDALSEELLVNTLAPLVSITEDGMLMPTKEFGELDPLRKTLATYLAIKALKLLGKREDEAAGPTEISKLIGAPAGTIKPAVRTLFAKKLLVSPTKGRYSIPPYSFRAAILAVQGEE